MAAGSLVLLDSVTASSSASVTLGTTDWDSSYNVYMVKLIDVTPATDEASIQMRFTKASDNSVDSSANYDRASKVFRGGTSFGTSSQQNQTSIGFIQNGTGTSETHNSTMWLYDFNNASEYSFTSYEEFSIYYDQELMGRNGGAILSVNQACNGVNYYYSSGNIASGQFRLYGLKK